MVGGGNSAGQASVFLAGRTRRVYLLLRSGDLGKSMSRYLVNRDMKAENVELLANTELRELLVEDRLDGNEYVRTAWTHAANFRSAGPFRLHRDSDTTGNALRQHIQQATWRTVEHVASHSAARSHGLRPWLSSYGTQEAHHYRVSWHYPTLVQTKRAQEMRCPRHRWNEHDLKRGPLPDRCAAPLRRRQGGGGRAHRPGHGPEGGS